MNINFDKYPGGLVPAIIQDNDTRMVLMMGYMNKDALNKTIKSGKVTFFSRSKLRLWTKGETSGNFLSVVSILHDCDEDTLLIKAIPAGPVCHTGADTCFSEKNKLPFLLELEHIISQRKKLGGPNSYTASLFKKGTAKIAQKVGEEAVELVIESMRNEDELFKNEAADLVYHFLVLLQQKGMDLKTITAVLEERHK